MYVIKALLRWCIPFTSKYDVLPKRNESMKKKKKNDYGPMRSLLFQGPT